MASVAGAVLAFPRIAQKRLAELLPRFLDAGRVAGAREASCWSLVPTTPRDLDDALQRSGFRTGWEARWMAAEISERRPGLPAGVRVALAPQEWEPSELLWDGAGIAMVRRRIAASTPRMVWHLGAWRGDAAVGHALVNVSRGRRGVVGVYDMGVEASERRGIGSALTQAALDLARSQGCAVATLNATPEGELLYRRLGFRSVGIARTWWR